MIRKQRTFLKTVCAGSRQQEGGVSDGMPLVDLQPHLPTLLALAIKVGASAGEGIGQPSWLKTRPSILFSFHTFFVLYWDFWQEAGAAFGMQV